MEKVDASQKEQIKWVGAELIRAQGSSAFRLESVAERIGVPVEEIRRFYPDEQSLIYELALECANDFLNTIQPIYEMNTTTRRKLELMMIAHVEVIIRNLYAAPIFFEEWRLLPVNQREAYRKLRDQYESYFREVIREGIESNEFYGPDEKFVALAILSTLNWTYQWYRPDGELTPKEIGQTLANILLHGIIRRY
jgi:AcrR family transcriptional regulator